MRFVPMSALVVLATLAAAPAHAQPYSASAFQAAQAAGKPIVVDVLASWCSTCKAQKPVVQALLQEPKYKNYVLFDVDFDKEKKALQKFDVQQQSTIIVFKGSKERARSTGETQKGPIQQMFNTAS